MLRKKLLILITIALLTPMTGLIADPVLDVSWSEEFGFPEFIDWNRAYADVFNGGPYTIPVTLHNAGDSDLIIEDITCEEQAFTARPTNLVLEPDQSSRVDFIFNARNPGEYASVVQIIWNSPNGEDFGIPVIAEAFGPPQWGEQPDDIEEFLFSGAVEEYQISIENIGGSILRWDSEIEYFEEDENQWITYAPQAGEIEPDGRTNIDITVDTHDLFGGFFEAALIIQSNVPDEPEISIGITIEMCVFPWFPVEWSEEFGFPDWIDFNGGYDEIFVGEIYSVRVEFVNLGFEPYTVFEIVCENEFFYVDDFEEFDVGVDERIDMEIIFEPQEPGENENVLEIITDNPDGEVLEIIVRAEVLEPPQWGEIPEDIGEDLLRGEVAEHPIPLENVGGSTLRWNSEIEFLQGGDNLANVGPRRDDAGEQLFEFDLNHIWIGGLDWDPVNRVMWAGSFNPHWIHAYSYDGDGNVDMIFERQLNPGTVGIGYLDGIIYTNQWAQHIIYRYDTDGNAIGNVESGCELIADFCTSKDRDWLFALNGLTKNIHIYDVRDDYREIGIIRNNLLLNQLQGEDFRSLCWVDDNRDGQLWVGTADRACQFFIDEELHPEFIGSFPTDSNSPWMAIGHDGENIWRSHAENSAGISVYDDGYNELGWLTYEPVAGEIEPGDETELTIIIDTRHLSFNGDYIADLILRSNVPQEPEIAIGIELTLFIPFWFVAEWSEEFGFPDVVDFDGYQETFVGSSYQVPINFQNLGGDVFTIESIECDNENFRIGIEEFELEPQEHLYTQIIFEPLEPGEYNGLILIETDDPDLDIIEIPVHASALDPLNPEHFNDFAETESSHQITITNLELEDERVPSRWEIGLFTPDDITAGGHVWYQWGRLIIDAYGDDANTEEIDGFIDGDYIRIRAWDFETGREYSARPTITDGGLFWDQDGETTLSLDVADDLFGFFIHEDWNLMSINIYPDERYYRENEDRGGPDVEIMMHAAMPDLDEHPILMKDEDGRFWASAWAMCLLPFWDLNEGYMMKFGRDVELFWHGELIPPDTEIPIEEGWNYLTYLPTYQLPCTAPDFYAFDSIIEELEIVKDPNGYFYVPQFEFSNMPPLQAGNAYQIKMSEEVVFTYPPEPEEEALAFIGHAQQYLFYYDRVEVTGSNMSLLLRGEVLQPGSEIGVYSNSGILVGSSTITTNGVCGLAVWGDDPTTEELEGSSDNESLEVKMWNSVDNTEIYLIVQSGNPVYQTDDFTVSNVSQKPETPQEFFLSEPFPNPFNNVVKLTYQLPEAASVSIEVFDTSGRLVSTLVNGNIPAGYHVVSWDGRGVSSGVYLLQVDVMGNCSTRKVTLVR
ncbi:MAG: T9SS type A sorting domain-containing protein [Calditrichaeota bacterium]|nr:T9SS type A sorting domain-containing protein [Calditrichota bacterium]